MPFVSKSQQRAAFGGYLGPEMKRKAKHWADVTPDIKHLPEHVEKKANFWNGFTDELFKYADGGIPGMAEGVSEAKMLPNINKPSHVSEGVVAGSIPKSYKPHIPTVKATHHATTPMVKYMGKSAGLISGIAKGIGGMIARNPGKALIGAATVGPAAYTVAKDTSNFMKMASKQEDNMEREEMIKIAEEYVTMGRLMAKGYVAEMEKIGAGPVGKLISHAPKSIQKELRAQAAKTITMSRETLRALGNKSSKELLFHKVLNPKMTNIPKLDLLVGDAKIPVKGKARNLDMRMIANKMGL